MKWTRAFAAVFLGASLHATSYQAKESRFLSDDELLEFHKRAEQPASLSRPRRLKLDPDIIRSASRITDRPLTPAGEWVARNIKYPRTLSGDEFNIIGKVAVDYILDAPDRANTVVMVPGGSMMMIESKSLGRAVFYEELAGFVGMADLHTLPPTSDRTFRRTMAKIWEARPKLPAEPNEGKVFSSPTPQEVDLAVKARAVSREQAAVLRKKGFLPINEVAGGTPWHPSDVDGWVIPYTEGTKTFPQTE